MPRKKAGDALAGQIPSKIKFKIPGGQEAALARQYGRNYLDKVITRIDFAASLGMGDNGPPKAVVDALKKRFPVPEPKTVTMVEVLSTPGGTQRSTSMKRQWYYHGKKHDRRLFIDDDTIFIEYDEYRNFDRLKRDFVPVVEAVFKAYENVQVKRIGLRYIDKIELREREITRWGDYFQKELLAAFGLIEGPSTLTRAWHVLERRWDDIQFRFCYGMPNPDYPSQVRRKQFVLDTDVFCARLIEKNEVHRLLDVFHHITKLNFEKSITDELRRKMKIKNHG